MNTVQETLKRATIGTLNRCEGRIIHGNFEVTEAYIETAFNYWEESEYVKLANHILDHREKERMEEREYERI